MWFNFKNRNWEEKLVHSFKPQNRDLLSRTKCVYTVFPLGKLMNFWRENEAVCSSPGGHVAAQRDSAAGLGSTTKRDASAIRECVSHLQERRKWPLLPSCLTYFLWRGRSSGAHTGAAQRMSRNFGASQRQKITTLPTSQLGKDAIISTVCRFVVTEQKYLKCTNFLVCVFFFLWFCVLCCI